MNKEFDLDKIGKRMPYQVEDGFFDELEKSVAGELGIEATEAPKPAPVKRRTLRIVSIATLMAAACLAFFVIFKPTTKATVGMQDVETAYKQLSPADQQYLLEAYQDDIFLSEQ